MSEREKQYKTLAGTWAAKSKIVGYCRLHRIHLTEAQMQKKQCIQKECGAFKKWECHYWEHKDRMREVRKMKKDAGIPPWQKVEIRTDRNGELLPKVKKKR